MNPAVVANPCELQRHRNEVFLTQLNAEPPHVQETVRTLLRELSFTELKAVLTLLKQGQELVEAQSRLDASSHELPNPDFQVGGPWGWIDFWLARLQGGKLDALHRIPYKQCHHCGKPLTEKRQKFFHPDCAIAYRTWRDNALDVAKRKPTPISRELYLRQKAIEKFQKTSPPRFLSVTERAWQISCHHMQTRFVHIPLEHTLQYTAQRFKIAAWLLRHYVQRRTLPEDHLPDLTLSAQELPAFATPQCLLEITLAIK